MVIGTRIYSVITYSFIVTTIKGYVRNTYENDSETLCSTLSHKEPHSTVHSKNLSVYCDTNVAIPNCMHVSSKHSFSSEFQTIPNTAVCLSVYLRFMLHNVVCLRCMQYMKTCYIFSLTHVYASQSV